MGKVLGRQEETYFAKSFWVDMSKENIRYLFANF